MNKEIAVIILNWNGEKLLKEFIPILIKYTDLNIADIIVADNNSSDNSLNYLKNYTEVKIISLDKNYGFAEGYNKAIDKIDSKYIVLLNSDVEVTENWLEPLFNLIKSDKNIAACVPKIKDYFNKNMFEYAGAAGGLIDKYGFPYCRGRIFDTLENDYGQYNENSDIFWASGACIVVRRDLYLLSGGLDSDFFAHMEEIDLCWRLKNMDYKIKYCYKSEVFHMGGGTLNKINPFKTYLNFRNNLFLLYKNLHKDLLFKTIFIRLIFDGIAGIKFLMDFKFSHFWAIIKAHFSFYFSLNKYKNKRKFNTESLFKKYEHHEILEKSVVIQYFYRKRKTFKDII